MANNPNVLDNLKPFVKGDARINRKGRIGNFAQLRKLALKIGNEPLDVNSPDVTRFLALLRVMSSSRNPADRKLFLEYAVGKVKEELDVTSDGKALPSAIVQVYIPDNGRDKTDKTPA